MDVVANAAFYYGVVRALAEAERPIWTRMSFSAAAENLVSAARNGIDARVYWPGMGQLPVTELVLRRLLPLAWEGLSPVGRRPGRRRAAARHHRAALPDRPDRGDLAVETVHDLSGPGDRRGALRRMTQGYIDRMTSNEPVHCWPRAVVQCRRFIDPCTRAVPSWV